MRKEKEPQVKEPTEYEIKKAANEAAIIEFMQVINGLEGDGWDFNIMRISINRMNDARRKKRELKAKIKESRKELGKMKEDLRGLI